MTATANLSVGLDTSSAKTSLLELKQFLAASITDLAVRIDPESIDRQIQGFFKQRTFKFRTDVQSFREIRNEIENEISGGVNNAFAKARDLAWNRDKFYGSLVSAISGEFNNKKRELSYNREFLKANIKSDIAQAVATPFTIQLTADMTALRAQMAGVVVPVLATQPAAGSQPAPPREMGMSEAAVIANAVKTSLIPAVDSIEKAAAILAGNARAQGVAGVSSTSGGSRRGARRKSARFPETGETVSFTESLDADKALEQINRQNLEDRKKKVVSELQKSIVAGEKEIADRRAMALRQQIDPKSSPDAAWAFLDAQRQKVKLPSADDAFEARRRQLQTEGQAKIDKDYAAALKEQIRQRLAVERQGISAAERWFRAVGEIEREIDKKAKDMARKNAQDLVRSREQIRGDDAYENLSQRIRDGAFNNMEAKNRKESKARAAVFDALEKADLQSRIALEKELDKVQDGREKARKAQNKQAAEEVREYLALQARAKAAADEINKTAAKAKADRQADLKKNLAFVAPGSVDELKRLEGQLKRVREAQFLINQGDTQLALKSYGSAAVAAAGNVQELENRVKNLRGVLEAQGRVSQKSAAQLRREELGSIYNAAKFQAKEKYTGDGVKIAAAQSLAQASSMDEARAFLGRDGYLLDQIGKLQTYTREINNATQAKGRMTSVVNELHSGIRGLTGTMGLLWLTWGSFVPLAAGAAMGASLRKVTEAGVNLEYQLRFVKELAEGTNISLEQFNRTLIGTAASPTEAAEALRALAQNGLSAEEALTALPEVLRLATVGEMELADAALGATGVMEAFGLTVNDLGRVGDVFAKAAAISNTNVAAMVESMKQASTVGDQYGITVEEAAASLAVLAKRNITGSAAGTAFRNMMVELATPTDKAKRAMNALGLEIFDANNKIKPFPQLMRELKMATDGLNEKSKLAFLGELFDERGMKAANAILADFGLFEEKLKSLNEETQGFARNFSNALGETTQVKLKRLLSEFEQQSVQAFFNSSAAVKNFVDELRIIVRSDEFKTALDSLFSSFVNGARYIIDNAKAIATLVGGLYGLKLVLPSIAAGMASIGLAATTAGAAFLRVAGAVTGIGGFIATLVIQFALLKKEKNEAQQAAENYAKTLQDQMKALDEELKRNNERIRIMAEENRLMREGNTLTEARRIAQVNLQRTGLEMEGAEILKQMADARAVIDRAQADKASAGPNDSYGLSATADREIDTQQRVIKQLEANYQAFLVKKAKMDQLSAAENYTRQVGEQQSLLDQARRLNREIESMREGGNKKADKIRLLDLDALEHARDSIKTLKVAVSETEVAINNAKSEWKPVDPKQLTQQNKDELAKLAEMQAGYKRSLQAADAYYKAEETILRARQQAKIITQEEYEARLSEMSREQMDYRLNLARSELSEIQKFSAQNPKLRTEQKARVETWIADANAEVQRLQTEINASIEQAQIKSEGALREIAQAGFDSRLKAIADSLRVIRELGMEGERAAPAISGALGPAADQALYPKRFIESASAAGMSREAAAALRSERDAERRNQFELSQRRKTENVKMGGSAASDRSVEAGLKVYDAWEPARRKMEAEIAIVLGQIDDVIVRKNAIEGTPLEDSALDQTLESLNRRLAEARVGLSAVEGQQEIYSDLAARKARELLERQRSAEYGMLSFWKNYQNQALDAATVVGNIMSQSFQSMEAGLMRFVTTGKLNFKELVRSIIADAARMLANAAIKRMLAMGLDFAMNSFGPGASTTAGAQPAGSGFRAPAGFTMSAMGNVMTPMGPLPLATFANGGIARRPMVSIFGEGKTPEAYVPLPDGRTIPVTMRGDFGGGNGINVSIAVTMQGGQTTERTESQQNAGTQFARQLEQAVRQVIVNEKRVGGLLEKA